MEIECVLYLLFVYNVTYTLLWTYVLHQVKPAIRVSTAPSGPTQNDRICTSCFDGWTTLVNGSTFCFPMKDCLPGTWRTTDDGSCIPCEPGSFSTTNNSVSCTSCAVGKYSHVKGSSSCAPRCGPGFYSTTTGESTFFSGTCIPCPLNFHAPDGSISVDNCTCAAGFFGPAGGPCSPCPTGTYKTVAGTSSSCTPCPIAG